MRIALGLEYDGTTYSGWQSQPDGNTVQDALERALHQIAGQPVRTFCAGRTDAGVHALVQIVHFDTDADRPLNAWRRGVNAHLPETIAVNWARQVPADFHARFSAQARGYRYLLLNRQQRTGLWAGKVGWYHQRLDIALMRQAAAMLLGEQDFSAFRSAECQSKSPVKTLQRCDIGETGDLVVFEFYANAFLHHMVRNLVGALVYVGSGSLSPAEFGSLLAAKDRRLAPPTFSPHGLYLAAIKYDACWGLPLREGMITNPLPMID